MITRRISRFIKYNLLKNRIYTARYGLIAGMKRKGGIDFLPKKISKERRYLMDLNLKGKTVYDVGGFIGILTLFFSRAVGDQGCVITFEPSPDNCRAIEEHLQLNSIKNVSLIPVGVGSKTDHLTLVVGDDPGKGSLVIERQEKIRKTSPTQVYQVDIEPLDQIMINRSLPKPDLVKIDVEGYEMEVLLGMQNIIQQYRPQFHIELHGIQEQEICHFLLQRQYQILLIEDDIFIDTSNVNKVHGHLFAC